MYVYYLTMCCVFVVVYLSESGQEDHTDEQEQKDPEENKLIFQLDGDQWMVR